MSTNDVCDGCGDPGTIRALSKPAETAVTFMCDECAQDARNEGWTVVTALPEQRTEILAGWGEES